MFSIFGLTITLAQIVELIPKVIEAAKVAQSIYGTLSAVHDNSAATEQAMGLLGKAVLKLVQDTIGLIPLPHKMTPEEEQLWFQHAQGTA